MFAFFRLKRSSDEEMRALMINIEKIDLTSTSEVGLVSLKPF